MAKLKASADPNKLTKRAAAVKALLERGEKLCARVGAAADEQEPERPQYWLEPSGRSAAPTAVRELASKGQILPSGDGLFDGFSQTWRLA
jgi:hypothetical protein